MLLFKKTLRTMGRYKAQFISMAVMVMIGAGVFLGFHIEWRSIEKTVQQFFDDTGFADYRLYDKRGFSLDDLRAVENMEGVISASRYISVNTALKGTDKTLNLNAVEQYGTPSLSITEGAAYDPDSQGLYLSDRFAKANGIVIGDTLTLSYGLFSLKGEVVSLVKSSEQLVCVADGNQVMPNYVRHGFVFITPAKLRATMGILMFYPQLNVRTPLDRSVFEEKLRAALGRDVTVLDKMEHLSYFAMNSEINEGKTMASVLPVLFLLIALLTMVTTMHRITANEKTQIGILKALGFRDKRILLHYTSFAAVVSVTGLIPGAALGFGLARMIINPHSMMALYFDVPCWYLEMPAFCPPLMLLMALVLIAVGYSSVRKTLRGTAAETLMPYLPKKARKLRIERLSLLKNLGFGTRWNLRDIFRHKARSWMTLLGIVGCMMLLVGALGMQDTMWEFLRLLNHETNRYATRINLAEKTPVADAEKLAQRYAGDWMAQAPARLNGGNISLEIYHTPHDLLRLMTVDNRPMKMEDDGVYVCIRLWEEGIRPGDTIMLCPYGTDQRYPAKVKGVFRSLFSKSVVMTRAFADKAGIPRHPAAVFTNVEKEDISPEKYINAVQSKKAIMESYDSFMQVMYTMVAMLALAAVIMAIAVLYNLGIMSYVERSRELATLKVVGFRDKKLSRLLISQNLWLTIVGIALGLPLGMAVLQYLLDALAADYELTLTMGFLTYTGSILLTLLTSLIVSFFVARKSRCINMVEALKGVD